MRQTSRHSSRRRNADSSPPSGSWKPAGRLRTPLVVRLVDQTELTVNPGESFCAAPGHDAWTLGDTPCVALDFPLA
jgi:hypothetical protein